LTAAQLENGIYFVYTREAQMKTQLAKWGNSLAVRIPKPVAEAAKLRTGDTLHLDVEGSGAVRIRKAMHEPTLRDLVRAITAENRHAETDWGSPVGNELW
jgi:antitoxin MazE